MRYRSGADSSSSIPPATPGEPSPALREFIAGFPHERSTIYKFVASAAASLAPGSRVYDIGAGEAPYRELFRHCEYVTVDWEHSVHSQAVESSIISSADALRVEDAAGDTVLLTQVLEHVVDPLRVLCEIRRILRPAGWLFATVPFAWELHEMPHDYWRFTPSSLELLLGEAGYVDVHIQARNDCLATFAQLLEIAPATLGRAPDGRDPEREKVSQRMSAMADELASWAGQGLDARGIFPLGWSIRARRPGALESAPPVTSRGRIAGLEAELLRLQERLALVEGPVGRAIEAVLRVPGVVPIGKRLSRAARRRRRPAASAPAVLDEVCDGPVGDHR